MISKNAFDVIAIMLRLPLLMTMQICSTTTTLALARTNNHSGSIFYMTVNLSSYLYFTKLQNARTKHFLLVQIQVGVNSLILLYRDFRS